MAHDTVNLNLADLDDGEAIKKVDDALRRIAKDLADRPVTPGKRSVTLKIEIQPDDDADAEAVLVTPTISYQVAASIPASKGRSTRGILEQDGKLLINRGDRQHPNQQTLDNVLPIRGQQG